jgi:glycerophosphoryl diester phosphodiesterase
MWPYPKVVAHRGGGTLAPENTLAAMRCGLEHGFRAVEFDVMLSKDNVPVLMHDPTFGRTVRGRGKVSDASEAELTAMDAGAWFSPRFAGEPVPSYARVVEYCRNNGIWMNVEIKPAPGFEMLTGRLVAEVSRQLFAGTETRNLPLFSSFSFEALSAAQAAAPDIPRGLLMDAIAPDWQARLRALGAVALHTNQRKLTRAQAQAVKQAGFGLFCYTVNSAARARKILSWGVDGFCTDRIDLIGPDFA